MEKETRNLLFWLPRVILCVYPTLILINGIYRAITDNFNVMGIILALMLAGIVFGFVYIGWQWPKIGGLMFFLFGVMTLFGTATGGIDFYGMLLAGFPITTAALLLIYEAFTRETIIFKDDKNIIIKELK